MSVTPKCNRVWNKQEKQIIRLLYRKGLVSPEEIENLYWSSFSLSGKRYRSKSSGRKYDVYLDEVHYCTSDYWGETSEHSVVNGIIDNLAWEGVPEDVKMVCGDDMWEMLKASSFQYKGRKWFIKYLKALPTVRCDSKVNSILNIRVY